jgi:hypothetical protein
MTIAESAIRMFKDRDHQQAQRLNANMDELKAARNGVEHDMRVHQETCELCRGKTPEELAALFGCSDGLKHARKYIDANRAVRNGGTP